MFQNEALTYVFHMKSRGMKAIDTKFPNGLPNSTLVTDRHHSYFIMNAKEHQICLAHLLRNAEYLNELDTRLNRSRRFIRLIRHSMDRAINLLKKVKSYIKYTEIPFFGVNLQKI